MGLLGPFMTVLLAVGMFLAFLGVAMLSLTLAAPIAYHANMLDVQYWTLDVLGGLPWVGDAHEYASAATFTILYVLLSVVIGLLGAFLMVAPMLVLN